MKNISISRYKINNFSKPFVIAEISSNHKWSLRHTLKLVKKIKEAGADAVKIQTYDENSMTFKSKKKTLLLNKVCGRSIVYLIYIKKQRHQLNGIKKYFNMQEV